MANEIHIYYNFNESTWQKKISTGHRCNNKQLKIKWCICRFKGAYRLHKSLQKENRLSLIYYLFEQILLTSNQILDLPILISFLWNHLKEFMKTTYDILHKLFYNHETSQVFKDDVELHLSAAEPTAVNYCWW